jgi:Uma2 family endonuclease
MLTDINKLDLNGSYTYADYLKWHFSERLELLRGKIFKMSPAPSRLHQQISINLSGTLFNYFKQNPCNLYAAPFDVRLVKQKTPDEKVITVVQPDLCVICDESLLDDKGCNGAPDLIIEILSPGNTKKEMGIKFDLYEENGVKEYWIVEPIDKTVFVYTLENNKYKGKKPFTEDDILTSDLFPNLAISLKEIFK